MIYRRVAETFVNKIKAAWESEDTLKKLFEKHFTGLTFSRTDHWQFIVGKLLKEAWYESGPEVKSDPIGYDRRQILQRAHPLLDYNLFTQVLLNLQNYSTFSYRTPAAEQDVEGMKASWPKDTKINPFEPKAKMLKTASNDVEQKYNVVLSTLRSLRIIAGITPLISSRVSPIGSTPTLTDSQNLSMLGIGADKYLTTVPGMKSYYICWQPGSSPEMIEPHPDGTFKAIDIPYSFHSKSGGDILNEVLFSRHLMYWIFDGMTDWEVTMIPRMNSILIVTNDIEGKQLKRVFDAFKTKYPMLDLVEGARV